MYKKRVLSGVQPTGELHIGNYLGALKQWSENQDHYDNLFCIVDLHALTIPENIKPKELFSKTREIAAWYIASGIDPKKSSIFIQSHVKEHTELCWILNCVTPVGWLEKMAQYKSKSQNAHSISTGLLDYPVLQAADILLYQTEIVPVGEDQKQHVELTRDIAIRFNTLFGNVFKVPEHLIRQSGARIMGLDNPEVKMSKSIGREKTGHSIGLLDDIDVIKKSIMTAVTDNNKEVRFEHASKGIQNLLTIYEVLTGFSKDEMASHFDGKGYVFLKNSIADVVISAIQPVQEKFRLIIKEKNYLDEVLLEGAGRARNVACHTMKRVRELTGLLDTSECLVL